QPNTARAVRRSRQESSRSFIAGGPYPTGMGRKRAKRRASTGTCLSTRDKDNSAPHRSSQRVCPIRTLPPWDTIAGRRRHGEGEAAMDDLLAEYRRATDAFESGDPVRAARMLEPIVAAEP